MPVCPHNDVAAVAAVPAVGSAFGDILLAAKTDRAVTTVAGFHQNFCFVDELHRKGWPYLLACLLLVGVEPDINFIGELNSFFGKRVDVIGDKELVEIM